MANERDTFPILDEDLLLSLPKARRVKDMDRMYTSPNSEDWMTWTMLRALQRTPGNGWWEGVVRSAEADAGQADRWSVLSAAPTVELWRSVPSPPAYEAVSRQRMLSSTDEAWRARAGNSRAVEGATEVDLVFDGDDYLVFVEAKFRSEISMGTTYDPDRNQIVRSIDCLIEEAGSREPFFWMLVAYRYLTLLYMSRIADYRNDPETLHRMLPHRDPTVLDRIIETLAVITWEDLLPLLEGSTAPADVMEELKRRTPHSYTGPPVDSHLDDSLP